jgi:hypothetical protein
MVAGTLDVPAIETIPSQTEGSTQMQVKQIAIGGEYAMQHEGKLIALQVTEIVSRRGINGTTNSVHGRIVGTLNEETGMPDTIKGITVDRLLGDAKAYQALVDEQQRAKNEQAQKEADRRAKIHHAARLLADALKSEVILERGYDKATEAKMASDHGYVMATYKGLDISEKALGKLIDLLESVKANA